MTDGGALLEPYFDRIRYAGARSVSLSTLHAICDAHVRAIPFENLDVLAGRGIRSPTTRSSRS